MVSRSNPGRSSRLRRAFDEEWLAGSHALDFIDEGGEEIIILVVSTVRYIDY